MAKPKSVKKPATRAAQSAGKPSAGKPSAAHRRVAAGKPKPPSIASPAPQSRVSQSRAPEPVASPGELSELTAHAVQFRDDRDWKQFHNPKDMALSMALEVAEVVELMQWKNGDALHQHLRARREDLADELSDVLYWILTIAHDFDINLADAFRNKLIKSAAKYPIEKSRGRSNKYTEL